MKGREESTSVAPFTRRESETDLVGATFGRYVVLEASGEGAMGTVYRAYDPRLAREVALKKLHTVRDDRSAATRIAAEARALGRLNHPNVVTIHDVVVEERGVAIAMEFVDGVNALEWLSTKRSARAILEVLVRAGEGLAAAHSRGLVHRDFKLSNIMVREGGGVKVVDFGLARADASATAEREPLSENTAGGFGPTAPAGTPSYMAPEQRLGSAPSAAADQYSFCVALWRALAGRPPFLGDGDDLFAAKLRGPPALPKQAGVSRRVARVLSRGLAVDPNDRWGDMRTLLDQIRPATSWVWRWSIIGGVAAVVVASIVPRLRGATPCDSLRESATGVWDPQARRSVQAALLGTDASYAAGVWRRADAVLGGYSEELGRARLETCEAVHVRHEIAASAADPRVACLSEARTVVAGAIDQLAMIVDAQSVARVDLLLEELPLLADCPSLSAGESQLRTAPSGIAPDASDAQAARLEAALTLGRFTEARDRGRAAWERSRQSGPPGARARVGRLYGAALALNGEIELAEPVFDEALQTAFAGGQDLEAAMTALEFARALARTGDRVDEGLWLARTGAAIAARPTSPIKLRWRAHSVLSEVHVRRGRYDDAIQLDEALLDDKVRVLGPGHQSVSQTRAMLGKHLYYADRQAEALSHLEPAVASLVETLGPDHPRIADVRDYLAGVLDKLDRAVEAEREYRLALEVRTLTFGPEHPSVLMGRHNLALCLLAQGRAKEADAELEPLIVAWRRARPQGQRFLAVALGSRAEALLELGAALEAEVLLRDALELGAAAFGDSHPRMVWLHNGLVRALMDQGRLSEARSIAELSESLAADVLAPDHRMSVTARSQLAQLQTLPQAVDSASSDEGRKRGTVRDIDARVDVRKVSADGVATDVEPLSDLRVGETVPD